MTGIICRFKSPKSHSSNIQQPNTAHFHNVLQAKRNDSKSTPQKPNKGGFRNHCSSQQGSGTTSETSKNTETEKHSLMAVLAGISGASTCNAFRWGVQRCSTHRHHPSPQNCGVSNYTSYTPATCIVALLAHRVSLLREISLEYVGV